MCKSVYSHVHATWRLDVQRPCTRNIKLQAEGVCSLELEHRQVKYLNNIIESDHGKLKRLIKPTLGFKSMKTAYATVKGFEVMRMFKKGRFDLWKYGQGIFGEIRIITDNLLAC